MIPKLVHKPKSSNCANNTDNQSSNEFLVSISSFTYMAACNRINNILISITTSCSKYQTLNEIPTDLLLF